MDEAYLKALQDIAEQFLKLTQKLNALEKLQDVWEHEKEDEEILKLVTHLLQHRKKTHP